MTAVRIVWLLFLLLPLAEIATFIVVGRAIGVAATLALVLMGGLLGTYLARREGFATLRAAAESFDRGEVPVTHVVSGAVLLVAAGLIAFPGFISDILGFALLFRPLRLKIGAVVLKAILAAHLRRGAEHRRTITLKARRIDGEEG